MNSFGSQNFTAEDCIHAKHNMSSTTLCVPSHTYLYSRVCWYSSGFSSGSTCLFGSVRCSFPTVSHLFSSYLSSHTALSSLSSLTSPPPSSLSLFPHLCLSPVSLYLSPLLLLSPFPSIHRTAPLSLSHLSTRPASYKPLSLHTSVLPLGSHLQLLYFSLNNVSLK